MNQNRITTMLNKEIHTEQYLLKEGTKLYLCRMPDDECFLEGYVFCSNRMHLFGTKFLIDVFFLSIIHNTQLYRIRMTEYSNGEKYIYGVSKTTNGVVKVCLTKDFFVEEVNELPFMF